MQEKLAEMSKRLELLNLAEGLYRRLNQYGLKLSELESKLGELASKKELQELEDQLRSKLAAHSAQLSDELSKLASKELLETGLKPLRELLRKQYDLTIGLKLEQQELREKLIRSDAKLESLSQGFEQSLSKLGSQLTQLESQLGSKLDWVGNWIRRITSDPKGLQTELSALDSELKALKSKRDSGELSESEYKSLSKPLQDELKMLQNLIQPYQELDRIRSMLSQASNELGAAIEQLKSKLAELNSDQAQHRTSIQTELESIRSQLQQLNLSLEALDRKFSAGLEGIRPELKAQYEHLLGIQKRHEERVSGVIQEILAKARYEQEEMLSKFRLELSEMDRKLAMMDSQQGRILEQFSKLDPVLDEVAKQGEFVYGLSEVLKQHVKKQEIEPLLKTIELQQQKLEELDKHLMELRASLSLEPRFQELENSQAQILDQIRMLTESLKTGSERIAGLESELESLRSGLDLRMQVVVPESLERRLSETSSELRALKQAQDQLSSKLTELERKTSSMIEQDRELIGSLRAQISELSAQISEFASARWPSTERFKQLELRRRAALEETLDLARAYHKAGLISEEEFKQILEKSKQGSAQGQSR